MKQDFIAAVYDKNLSRVRISLSNELLLDPRGTSFTEMLKFAEERLADLFEENHISDYDVPPQEEWNKSFLFEVKDDLDSNFSREKLELYQVVIKTVGKSKADEINELENHDEAREIFQQPKYQEINNEFYKTYATISAGGAILAILIGMAINQTLLVVFGGLILVEGGVLLTNNHFQNR